MIDILRATHPLQAQARTHTGMCGSGLLDLLLSRNASQPPFRRRQIGERSKLIYFSICLPFCIDSKNDECENIRCLTFEAHKSKLGPKLNWIGVLGLFNPKKTQKPLFSTQCEFYSHRKNKYKKKRGKHDAKSKAKVRDCNVGRARGDWINDRQC